jgi:hypothetical protein
MDSGWEQLKIGKDYEINNVTHEIRDKNGRIIKMYKSKDGNWKVSINSRTYNFHRLLALQYIPNPLNCNATLHKDRNRDNNSLDNIDWTEIEFSYYADNGYYRYRTDKPYIYNPYGVSDPSVIPPSDWETLDDYENYEINVKTYEVRNKRQHHIMKRRKNPKTGEEELCLDGKYISVQSVIESQFPSNDK